MTTAKYAAYPKATLYDGDEKKIQELLWGDWVGLRDAEPGEKVPEGDWIAVRVRGKTGFMKEFDLQDNRVLELIFVDVGQGDGCLVVTPDDRKLIIDAGVKDNMYNFLRWRFRFRSGQRDFDAAIITHPDVDHYKGFNKLFDDRNVYVKHVYHNGLFEFDEAEPFGETDATGAYITELIQTTSDLNRTLAQSERYGDKEYPALLNRIASRPSGGSSPESIEMLRASTRRDERRYVPSFGADAEVSLRVVGPVPFQGDDGTLMLRTFPKSLTGTAPDKGYTKNGNSVVLILEYGQLRVLLGGDLNAPAEVHLLEHYSNFAWSEDEKTTEELVEKARDVLESDVLKCCHHGSEDFTHAFLRAVNPLATVISSGDEETYAHPRSDTLGAIGRYGRGERPLIFSTELARSTREDNANDAKNIRRLVKKLQRNLTAKDATAIHAEIDELADNLERNVSVYGAINLRSDGEKVVMAYRFEVDEKVRWDTYLLELGKTGSLEYTP